jgi:hypothetical protein
MKSLRPKETTSNAISVKAAKDLENEIAILQEQIVALRNNIDTIENTLESPNVGRGDANFGSLIATDLQVNRNATLNNASISDLNSNNITTPDIEATNATVTNVLDANQINTPELNTTDVKASTVQTDSITTTNSTATTISTNTLSADEATLSTANIATANINNYITNTVQAVKVEAPSIDTDELTALEATITDLQSTNATIEEANVENARIENRYYISDKPGKTIQLTQVEEQHPAWICLDTRGLQNAKIIAKDTKGELFSVIYSNTRHTPLIQWSKRNDEAIQRFFYQYKTNKLYIETWVSCEFQWQIDGYEKTPFIPQTYQDTFPENLLDCYKYSCSRKHGIVLMGEKGSDTVLSVQGVIEGSFLIDNGEFTYIDFYSDSAWDLFNVAKNFFRSGSDEDGWQYEKAECWGYLKHTATGEAEHYDYIEHVSTDHYIYDFEHTSWRAVGGSFDGVAVQNLFDSADFTNISGIEVSEVYVITTPAETYYVKNEAGEYVEVGGIWWIDPKYLSQTPTDLVFLDTNGKFICDSIDDVIVDDQGRHVHLYEGNTYTKPRAKYYTREEIPASPNPYMDEDGTEIEALEKIEYVDENTIKLTIDNHYGQDEITINCEDLQEDEKLPFILGFTIRTPRIDYVFNREAKQIDGNSGDSSYYG